LIFYVIIEDNQNKSLELMYN